MPTIQSSTKGKSPIITNNLSLNTTSGETIPLGKDTLVVALDDTGHEEFKDHNHPVFGLGGCAFLVKDYMSIIANPWEDMCTSVFSEHKRPLHASEMGKLNDLQIRALSNFFKKNFLRLAVMVDMKTSNQSTLNFIEVVASVILNRIIAVTQNVYFDRCYIIVEDSERTGVKIMKSLAHREIIEQSTNKSIEIDLGLAPKKICFPALEVADFIIHTAGAQVRNEMVSHERVIRKDFEVVFNPKDKRIASYIKIQKIG